MTSALSGACLSRNQKDTPFAGSSGQNTEALGEPRGGSPCGHMSTTRSRSRTLGVPNRLARPGPRACHTRLRSVLHGVCEAPSPKVGGWHQLSHPFKSWRRLCWAAAPSPSTWNTWTSRFGAQRDLDVCFTALSVLSSATQNRVKGNARRRADLDASVGRTGCQSLPVVVQLRIVLSKTPSFREEGSI